MVHALGISCDGSDSAAAIVRDGRLVAAVEEERFTRRKREPGFPGNAVDYCLGEAGIGLGGAEVAVCGKPPANFGKHTKIPREVAQAASAFLASPFEEAAILVVGEKAIFAVGRGNGVEVLKDVESPSAVYAGVTARLGFKPNADESKVMGLAAYGKPVFDDLEGEVPKPQHKDLAASVQKFAEEMILGMARQLRDETGMEDLCIAGSMGLNSVANGRLLRSGIFRDIFVQPAAGMAGCALGAALLAGGQRCRMEHAYFGPESSNDEIGAYLGKSKIKYEELDDSELLRRTASLLWENKIVGWFQGRMEWGPRALGNRSILANPCEAAMKDVLNRKVKKREEWRPFAPSVVAEDAGRFFETDRGMPFMLFVCGVKGERLPAVTHVDGSARIQTVRREDNLRYYGLIKEFEKLSGVPVALNTSFNSAGEPIVCTPEDAVSCFEKSGMDALVIGNFLVG